PLVSRAQGKDRREDRIRQPDGPHASGRAVPLARSPSGDASMRPHGSYFLVLAGAALFHERPSRAQVESALLSKVSFNLSNPGGKSLAMGGAFTAIADDATAALANPAGLGLLSSFEVGISAKRTDDVIGLVTARATATG